MDKYLWKHEFLNGTNNSRVIYQPATGFVGEVIDFFATIKLTSCNEMPTVSKPDGIELMTEAEKHTVWREQTELADKKILKIEFINHQTIASTATEVILYKITPSYNENLVPYLSTRREVIVPENCSIKASVTPYNCGILQGTDIIEFRMLVYEKNPEKSISELALEYVI